MNDEKKFRKWQKRLQPGRNSLLLNGEWGAPLANFSKAKAKEKGLAAWNHRWVETSALQVLKPQYRAYRRIKAIAAIITCIGLYVLSQAPEKIGTVQLDVRGLVAAGSVLLYPFFHFAVAWGVAKYKNLARWIAVVLFPLLIPPSTFYVNQTNEIGNLYMVVFAFFVFMLVAFFSKTARVIFATGAKNRTSKAVDETGKETAEKHGDGA